MLGISVSDVWTSSVASDTISKSSLSASNDSGNDNPIHEERLTVCSHLVTVLTLNHRPIYCALPLNIQARSTAYDGDYLLTCSSPAKKVGRNDSMTTIFPNWERSTIQSTFRTAFSLFFPRISGRATAWFWVWVRVSCWYDGPVRMSARHRQ